MLPLIGDLAEPHWEPTLYPVGLSDVHWR